MPRDSHEDQTMKLWIIAGGIVLLGSAAAAHAGGGSTASVATARPIVGSPHLGPGRHIGIPGRHHGDKPRRRHRGKWNGFTGFYPVWGYYGDGDGYVESEVTPDMFGYFATGGEVELVDGEAIYDYDRSYPYEWFRPDQAGRTGDRSMLRSSEYRCELTSVPAISGKGRTEVRICRR
jgi:hypothetical protein